MFNHRRSNLPTVMHFTDNVSFSWHLMLFLYMCTVQVIPSWFSPISNKLTFLFWFPSKKTTPRYYFCYPQCYLMMSPKTRWKFQRGENDQNKFLCVRQFSTGLNWSYAKFCDIKLDDVKLSWWKSTSRFSKQFLTIDLTEIVQLTLSTNEMSFFYQLL